VISLNQSSTICCACAAVTVPPSKSSERVPSVLLMRIGTSRIHCTRKGLPTIELKGTSRSPPNTAVEEVKEEEEGEADKEEEEEEGEEVE
jgi:hypothetical protein